MEEKTLGEKINLWSRIISKSFPFIKKIEFDEERDSTIFLNVIIDFIEFADFLDAKLRGSFLHFHEKKVTGGYLYLPIPFEEEDKDKVEKFQKNLNNFFNDIVIEHLPINYKPNKLVSFFTFIPYYED